MGICNYFKHFTNISYGDIKIIQNWQNLTSLTYLIDDKIKALYILIYTMLFLTKNSLTINQKLFLVLTHIIPQIAPMIHPNKVSNKSVTSKTNEELNKENAIKAKIV